MAIVVEEYSVLSRDPNRNLIPVPDVGALNAVQAGGDAFQPSTSYVIVTSDADDLIAFGVDGSEGTPNIPVKANVARAFKVPAGQGWSVTI